VELGRELGYTLKLLAIAKRFDHEVEIRVHPTFIHSEEALAKVSGVYNAVMIEGDFVGKTMFYGKGAGSLPTASAVVSDVVDVGVSMLCGSAPEITPVEWETEEVRVRENFFSRYYLRFDVPDRPGVLASVARVLAEFGISIAAVLQKEMVCELAGKKGESLVPLVIPRGSGGAGPHKGRGGGRVGEAPCPVHNGRGLVVHRGSGGSCPEGRG